MSEELPRHEPRHPPRRGRGGARGREQEPARGRRRGSREPAPEMPTGWRSSRRGSGVRKQAERDIRVHEVRERVGDAADAVRRGTEAAVYVGVRALGATLLGLFALWLVVTAINGVARWNAVRIAEREASPEAREEAARQNLLLIGVTEGRATGFLALRVVPEQDQVFGIAIPDGAFVEIPGQGFDRIGESLTDGPETSLSAVTNFFTVPFNSYVVVDSEVYQRALTEQDVSGILAEVGETNLTAEESARWSEMLAAVPVANVALVPMPVKPVNVGDQTYFEPQRDEIADLVASWWGVTIDAADGATRVIVYNGSGEPGIAGQVAQVLIRGGFRVVDTKNADRFDYEVTQIVVQSGDPQAGQRVRETLGTGEVVEQPAEQEVADVIVIVGADYEEPGAP